MPTPQQLATIQKLIDKDASDEDIQTVLDHFKAQQTVSAVPSSEPDTYLGGFLKGGLEGMTGGAKGFAEGFVPGVIHAVPNLVKGVVDAGVDTVKGIANFYNDPSGTVTKALAGAKSSATKLPQLAQDLAKLAAQDPEKFGQAVGDLTGNAEAMMALAAAAPLMPRPIALKVGQTLQRTGKAGEFAAYLTGAHQIAAGKPEGIVTIAVPSAMRAAATPLIRFGSKGAPGIPVSEQIAMQPEAPQPALHQVEGQLPPTPAVPRGPVPQPPTGGTPPIRFADKPLIEQMDQLPATPAPARGAGPGVPAERAAGGTPAIRFNDLPLHEQMNQLPVGADAPAAPIRGRGPEPPVRMVPPEPAPATTGGLSADEVAGLKKAGWTDEKIAAAASRATFRAKPNSATVTPAPVEPVAPAAAEPLPTTGKMEDALAKPGAALSEADYYKYKGNQYGDDLPSSVLPTEMRDQIGSLAPDEESWFKPYEEAMAQQLGVADAPEFSFEGSGPTDVGMGGPKPGPEIGSLPLKQLAGEVDNGLPAGAEVSGEASPTPGEVPPGPTVGGDLGIKPQTFEEALASAMAPGTAKPATAPEPPPINMTEPTVVPDNDPRLAGPAPASAIKPRVRVSSEGKPTGRYTDPTTGEEMHPIQTALEPSRSRRGKAQMSATKGYTKADMAAMNLDPTVVYTHLTKAQAEAGAAARRERASKYYAKALEDKAAAAEAGM